MSAALKLVPDSEAPTLKPRLRDFSLRDAFSRGLDRDLERPPREACRAEDGRPMIFRVTYEAVFSLESDGYCCGNAAKTVTCLAMDAVTWPISSRPRHGYYAGSPPRSPPPCRSILSASPMSCGIVNAARRFLGLQLERRKIS